VPQHWDDGRSRDGCNVTQENGMEIDKEKVDEFTLALLYLTTFENKLASAGVEEP
jgi:hypothetical protein